MTRPRHAHAHVRHAFADRIRGRHRPARRLTALAMSLTVTATTLTPAPVLAAPPARRAVPTTAGSSTPAPDETSSGPSGAPSPKTPPAPRPASPSPPPGGTPTRDALLTPGAPSQQEGAPSPAPPDTGDATLTSAQDVPEKGSLPELPESLRLEQRFAEYVLRGNGIRWRSTGGCSDRTIRTCTSFEGVRWGTVKGLIGFAKSSGCKVTVTGGTERGHAPGTYSHANGYKLDIAPSRCVDRAIKRYPAAGTRGDGARLHRAPDGTVFAREKDHWDITFR